MKSRTNYKTLRWSSLSISWTCRRSLSNLFQLVWLLSIILNVLDLIEITDKDHKWPHRPQNILNRLSLLYKRPMCPRLGLQAFYFLNPGVEAQYQKWAVLAGRFQSVQSRSKLSIIRFGFLVYRIQFIMFTAIFALI